MKITLNKRGIDECGHYSFPVRFGNYHQVETRDAVFHFSPSWRLIFAQSKAKSWPNPNDWLKLGLSGRATYYSSVGYGDISLLFNQHYFPIHQDFPLECLSFNPFGNKVVTTFLKKIKEIDAIFEKGKEFIEIRKALDGWDKFYRFELGNILRTRINILPPDSSLCDYQVFPMVITTGCLQNCGFCSVKEGTELTLRSRGDIKAQALELFTRLESEKSHFKGIFLGTLDALNAPKAHLVFAMELGKMLFPHAKRVFMFGSVLSLLERGLDFFEDLNQQGLDISINIGIESLDKETLDILKKPIPVKKVMDCWHFSKEINRNFDRIEISANILINRTFPEAHLDILISSLKKEGPFPKGTLYLSPYNSSIDRYFIDVAKAIRRVTKRPVRPYPLVAL